MKHSRSLKGQPGTVEGPSTQSTKVKSQAQSTKVKSQPQSTKVESQAQSTKADQEVAEAESQRLRRLIS